MGGVGDFFVGEVNGLGFGGFEADACVSQGDEAFVLTDIISTWDWYPILDLVLGFAPDGGLDTGTTAAGWEEGCEHQKGYGPSHELTSGRSGARCRFGRHLGLGGVRP